MYKIYKRCFIKKTSCCGVIPNICIRVKQNVEPISPDSNKYVTRYVRRNRVPENTTIEADDSDEENVTIEPQSFSRKSIGFSPSRRPTTKQAF